MGAQQLARLTLLAALGLADDVERELEGGSAKLVPYGSVLRDIERAHMQQRTVT